MALAQDVQRAFLGRNPTELQLELYVKGARGVSSKERDPEKTDAVLFIAMGQAKESGTDNYHQVYVITPVTEKPWVLERIYNLALAWTDRVKQAKAAKVKSNKPVDTRATMKLAKTWLERLQVGCPSSWEDFPPPERWVAIGYTKEDAIPAWMRDALD
jgi:hypothetical protein